MFKGPCNYTGCNLFLRACNQQVVTLDLRILLHVHACRLRLYMLHTHYRVPEGYPVDMTIGHAELTGLDLLDADACKQACSKSTLHNTRMRWVDLPVCSRGRALLWLLWGGLGARSVEFTSGRAGGLRLVLLWGQWGKKGRSKAACARAGHADELPSDVWLWCGRTWKSPYCASLRIVSHALSIPGG